MSIALRCALVAALAFTAARPGTAHAQTPGEDLTVHVLTFGPGDHPFFKFGHNAIWIQPRVGDGLVFNFGTFTFDSPMLIPEFLKGRLRYWLSVGPAGAVLQDYIDANRTVEAQELDLTPAERFAMLERLRENARPDKREYLYDYFWDNCSTRVRDVVDGIVGGRVRTAGERPANMTLRHHALRMTADLPWEYVLLHLGLGSTTDGPLTIWYEAFLPERLRDLLRTVRLPREGGERPLVKSERVLFTAKRPPILTRPPRTAPWFALAGVVAGGSFALLGRAARRSGAARVALGSLASFSGLIFGFLGLALVLLWALTNHRAAHANANILQMAPWALALVVFGVGVARGRARATRRALVVAASAALASVVGLVVKVLPGVDQDNLAFIVMMLPLWAGLAVGLRALLPFRRAP